MRKNLYMGWRGGSVIFPLIFDPLPHTRGGWEISQKMRDCNTQLAKKSWVKSVGRFGRDGRLSVKKRSKKWPWPIFGDFHLKRKNMWFFKTFAGAALIPPRRWQVETNGFRVELNHRYPIPKVLLQLTQTPPKGGLRPPKNGEFGIFHKNKKSPFWGGRSHFRGVYTSDP